MGNEVGLANSGERSRVETRRGAWKQAQGMWVGQGETKKGPEAQWAEERKWATESEMGGREIGLVIGGNGLGWREHRSFKRCYGLGYWYDNNGRAGAGQRTGKRRKNRIGLTKRVRRLGRG